MYLLLFSDTQLQSATDLFAELFNYYTDQPAALEDIKSHLENLTTDVFPMKIVLAIGDNNHAIGMAAFHHINSLIEPDNLQCQMKELFVSKEYRNKGIVRELMKWVIDEAKSKGCARIDWNVKAENIEGRRFMNGWAANKSRTA